ncbi:isovaleryl-CoA dehydrogenase [Skeletonema marinoi]|uniref:Isovaleryl-CoA dehydrogenase n=1 Tax=Skeletonema marinoi TaxID=267567 RepID=A0AAD8YBU7_9STRA|nr:isovaleryl-CoA dehydrogenase [Skeletonema marinoi]
MNTNSLTKLFNPTDDHAALREMVRSFTEREVEPQALDTIEVKHSINDGLGILGLTAPDEFGGTGLPDATAVSIVHEELSYSDPALCLSYLAHSILLVNNLAVNANDEQLALFMPGICDGSKIGGMCMSEPNAGTDVLGMKSNAVYDSARDGFILNGTKMWITNGTLTGKETGDLFLVYARTGPRRGQILLSLWWRKAWRDKLGMRASPTAELVFENVFLPAKTHVVGDVNGATLCMMRNLEIERVALAAMAVGIARRSLDEMIAYASNRPALARIQKHISESYAEYMAGKCYLYAIANGLDLSTYGNGLDADGVKLYCATMAKNVADRAIQVMGGYGYCGEYTVERLWRDAKLLEIGGGTNESHHKNMARDLHKLDGNKLE